MGRWLIGLVTFFFLEMVSWTVGRDEAGSSFMGVKKGERGHGLNRCIESSVAPHISNPVNRIIEARRGKAVS